MDKLKAYLRALLLTFIGKYVKPIEAGDIVSNYAFTCTGYLTSGRTELYFSIPFNCPILATQAVITNLKMIVRSEGAYIVGSGTAGQDVTAQINSCVITPSGINVDVIFGSAIGSTNNVSVNVFVTDMTISFS